MISQESSARRPKENWLPCAPKSIARRERNCRCDCFFTGRRAGRAVFAGFATQWGVGPKQQARGVLILLAPNDRKYRVEVGYGLEAILPDGKVGGFGREWSPCFSGTIMAAP